jgi:hypothetical protein
LTHACGNKFLLQKLETGKMFVRKDTGSRSWAFLAEVAALFGCNLDGNLYMFQGMKEEPIY